MYMFTRKLKPLSLTQFENYFYTVFLTKFQAKIKNLPIKILKLLKGLKIPKKLV